MAAQLDILEGTAVRVGSYGFTLAGREGWVSVSKFAEPRPQLPAEGQRVRVGLDKSGYARSVTVLTAAPAEDAQQPATRAETAENGLPAKERQIIRMNVLGHATAIVARSGKPVPLADVLRVAAELEAWVTRTG